MTENNDGVLQKKVTSKKNQGLQHREGKRWMIKTMFLSIIYSVIFHVEAFRTKWLSKGLYKVKDK